MEPQHIYLIRRVAIAKITVPSHADLVGLYLNTSYQLNQTSVGGLLQTPANDHLTLSTLL